MLRTQAIVGKNKKKSQTSTPSSIKLNKVKALKSESGDKLKIKTITAENGKIKSKSSVSVQVQDQKHFQNVNYLPNPSEMNNFPERKLERAKTFFLTRQLTKIYDSLANSKENLKENAENLERKEPKPAFKFMRSVSLAAISLKKEYRNSMRKPNLEQLSEEDHTIGIPISISQQKKPEKKNRTISVDSLSSRTSDKSSVISSFKRTFSLTPSRRKTSNPKWSASLMSLQQIDVMISYEDLSFIDYDKFNTYEENLMTKIKSSNQNDVNRTNIERYPPVRMRARSNTDGSQRRHSSTAYQPFLQNDEQTIDWLNGRSKRWSNPCITPNIETASFPSYASIVKDSSTTPADRIDECDCKANTDSSIENRTTLPSHIAHSVDDITGKSNENTDFMLQAVST